MIPVQYFRFEFRIRPNLAYGKDFGIYLGSGTTLADARTDGRNKCIKGSIDGSGAPLQVDAMVPDNWLVRFDCP